MPWELDNDRPIYLQLMERIQRKNPMRLTNMRFVC